MVAVVVGGPKGKNKKKRAIRKSTGGTHHILCGFGLATPARLEKQATSASSSTVDDDPLVKTHSVP